MPTMEAYLAMQQHRHAWVPLDGEAAMEWCPDCGAARLRRPETDD